jgi:hypothetical protein
LAVVVDLVGLVVLDLVMKELLVVQVVEHLQMLLEDQEHLGKAMLAGEIVLLLVVLVVAEAELVQ